MQPTAAPQTPASAPGPGQFIYVALALSALLVVAAIGLFYYATRTAKGPERGHTHKVIVNDATCEPADFTLPAGVTTFEIHNASRRPLEWEILDGVMVVAERENIAPGFHSLLTVKLRPGSFAITCGLLSNPRGSLTVTPTESSEAERLRPPIEAFIGPLSESRVHLIMQSGALHKQALALAEAVAAGDVNAARAHWLQARAAYKRIEGVAGRFADLEARIDPLASYLAQREDDPAFTGFHRLEKALFQQGSADGVTAIAQQLAADADALKTRLRELQQKPEDLSDSALWLIHRLQEGALAQGENPYAQTDLADVHANLEGMEKIVLLTGPLLQGARPELAAQVQQSFAAVRDALQAHQLKAQGQADAEPSWPPYAQITPEQRAQLSALLGELADAIAQINPALGLE
ncbi:MAG: iron uptake system protein EfeO [Comamonadaceae bacterium]|nr:iron uptake system protein EfeO [Comamonadaceae bacterium]